MLFTRTAVHGMYTLCYLDREHNGSTVSAPVVAVALGIPQEQASKVLQSLNNAGLVESVRGRRGGYKLVKRLDEIAVLEVLDAVDPPEDDERLRPKSCKRDSKRMCRAHLGLLRLSQGVRQALAGESLKGLAGTVCTDTVRTDQVHQTVTLSFA